jgi:hypothetical protein
MLEGAEASCGQRSRALVTLSRVAKATVRSTARRTASRHFGASVRGLEEGENMCSGR